ncbi:MAG: lipoprotein insertase outer membrane protein LolB, partial [Nevskiales bacterium]
NARMATALLGWSGSLDWQQSEQNLQIAVSGPLGIGGFKAQGSLNYVQVITSDGQKLQGDPEVLYRQVVGWHFPLRGMRYWALGLPVPGKPHNMSLDAAGRVEQMRQDGWLIHYTEYRNYGERELPRRMRLEKDDLNVRIVIDDWRDVGAS